MLLDFIWTDVLPLISHFHWINVWKILRKQKIIKTETTETRNPNRFKLYF